MGANLIEILRPISPVHILACLLYERHLPTIALLSPNSWVLVPNFLFLMLSQVSHPALSENVTCVKNTSDRKPHLGAQIPCTRSVANHQAN